MSSTHSRLFFFFNDTATTEIYTLSLHDALPISALARRKAACARHDAAEPQPAPHGCALDRGSRLPQVHRVAVGGHVRPGTEDRKSTRLNSSHSQISYAVFCLKKKKITQ